MNSEEELLSTSKIPLTRIASLPKFLRSLIAKDRRNDRGKGAGFTNLAPLQKPAAK